MKHVFASLAIFLLATQTLHADVKITESKDGLQVKIDGKVFADYTTSKDWRKPYFSPVRAADGTILTRPIGVKGNDHPHHKGIWVSVDKVNGVRFWNEDGVIENTSVKVNRAQGDSASFTVTNNWNDPKDGSTLIVETTDITIYSNRLMTYAIKFTAAKDEITFGDTKEGLFGFRMVNSMRENEGGSVINAEGRKGTGECWGQPSAWIDYYGKVEGKVYGVTLMDHPGNFRPSRYHVRNYGLFSISPFGDHAYSKRKEPEKPVNLKKGESISLTYGLLVHDGDTKQGKVADGYKQFLAETK